MIEPNTESWGSYRTFFMSQLKEKLEANFQAYQANKEQMDDDKSVMSLFWFNVQILRKTVMLLMDLVKV